jgi:hypothetical protein
VAIAGLLPMHAMTFCVRVAVVAIRALNRPEKKYQRRNEAPERNDVRASWFLAWCDVCHTREAA